jgi:hypothetical protein
LKTLPKLVPKSCIIIGLSKRQIYMYKGTYKYIVFTIIISAIFVPFVFEMIKIIAGMFS